jgi:diamine N-acetyltransferase
MEFRRTTEEDLDFVEEIEGNAASDRFVESWSREQHVEALSDPDQRHFVVESGDEPEPVGFILLAGVDSPHRNIEFRRIVIGPKNRGLGRQALRLLKDFAFGELGAHRLWLDVKDFNERARALYVSEGFVEEGTLRECVKGPNGYESVVIMSIIESEYVPR